MQLREKQKKYLRGLAHDLKPCIQVGAAGVTPAVLQELHQALEHHELIKIRVRSGERATRDIAIDQLVAHAHATLVRRIGNIAILYRPRRKDPAIILPESRRT